MPRNLGLPDFDKVEQIIEFLEGTTPVIVVDANLSRTALDQPGILVSAP